MKNQLLKSCGVALPKGRNSATFDLNTATIGTTNTQPIGLKALAIKALHRNIDRNLPATETKTDRNFSPENLSCGVAVPIGRNSATSEKGAAVGLILQTESPAPCEGCTRLEAVEIQGKAVHGCLYLAPGQYFDGWRRIPIDLKQCVFN